MECQKKKRSSYQTLKEDYQTLYQEFSQKRYEREILWEACMKIAQLKGPDVIKAPEIALIAMARSDEKA